MTTAAAQQQETLILETDEILFLTAWKKAVQIVGPTFFSCNARTPADASHWHALTPKLDVMRKAIPNKSRQDAAFMAVVASLFNPEEGQKFFTKSGTTFGALMPSLTLQQQGVLLALLAAQPIQW